MAEKISRDSDHPAKKSSLPWSFLGSRMPQFVGACLLNPLIGHAQEGTVEMADFLRSEGKFYVIIVVILIIFLGFLGYLYYTIRRISSLERMLRAYTKKEKA